MSVATGTSMQLVSDRVRFAKKNKGGRPCSVELNDRVVEIRQMLRTDAPLDDIAAHFGVGLSALRAFIKRRRLCDIKARREFLSLQASLAKLDGGVQ